MTNKTNKPIFTIIDKTIQCSVPIQPPVEFNILECRRATDEGFYFEDAGIIKNFNWYLWPGIWGVTSLHPTQCFNCHEIDAGPKVYAVPQPFYQLGQDIGFKWFCKECLKEYLTF